MICQKCGCVFDPWRERQKFCSVNCADENKRRVDLSKLGQLVFMGESKAEISRQLGVSYTTVRRAIADYGFECMWREQRYA